MKNEKKDQKLSVVKKAEKQLKFYSEKSSIQKAWEGLWDRPKVTVDEVIRLNKEFLDKFYKSRNL